MGAQGSGAVLAKAHSLYGKRMTDEDYRQMARMHSFPEAVSFLKNSTYFSASLTGIQENFIGRPQIELLLRKDLYERGQKLRKYVQKNQDNSVYSFSRWYAEIQTVLLALRQVNLRDMATYTSLLPSYLIGQLSFDPMELSRATSQDDLCRLLSDTPYGKLIGEQMRHADGRFRVSRCEAVLYQYYYDKVFTVIEKQYKGKDRRDLTDLFQKEVEFLNTNMIYRYKRYFGGKPEDIRPRLIERHDKRPKATLEKMISTSSATEVLRLAGEYAGGLTGEDITKRSIWRDRQRFKNYKAHFYLTDNPDVTYIAYMNLSEMEVIKVTRLLEGVYYMEDPATIEAMAIYS